MELRATVLKREYIRYVIRYAEYFNESPNSLGTDEIKE